MQCVDIEHIEQRKKTGVTIIIAGMLSMNIPKANSIKFIKSNFFAI